MYRKKIMALLKNVNLSEMRKIFHLVYIKSRKGTSVEDLIFQKKSKIWVIPALNVYNSKFKLKELARICK
jgi:hypothetical protein